VTHGAPKVVRYSFELHENLIQMPYQVRISLHLLQPFSADFSGEHWTKTVPPISNWFTADINTALVQHVLHILHIAMGQWEPHITQNRQADNSMANFENSEMDDVGSFDEAANPPHPS